MKDVKLPASPILGMETVQASVPAPENLVADAQKLVEQRAFDGKAFEALADKYVHDVMGSNTIFDGKQLAAGTFLKIDLRPTDKPSQPRDEQLVESMRRDMAAAGMALVQIWNNGFFEEREVKLLEGALARIADVLKLKDAFGLLGRDDSRPLKAGFELLERLQHAGQEQLGALQVALMNRDGVALEERLKNPVATYSQPDLAQLEQQGVVGLSRFKVGDLVALEHGGLGVVAGTAIDGKLRVESLRQDGKLELHDLSGGAVSRANPLKIGDRFQVGELQLYVKPSKAKGVEVIELGPDGQLRDVPIDEAKRTITGLLQREGTIIFPSKPPVQELVYAGQAETGGVIPVSTGKLGVLGALYGETGPDSRGNGDAAVLTTVGKSLVMGVADGASRSGGAISAISIAKLIEAGRDIDAGMKPAQAFERALSEAKKAITDGKHAGFTTLTGLVAQRVDGGWLAHTLQVGDSIAWQFSSRGRVMNQTAEHNAARELADVGLMGRISKREMNSVTSYLSGESKPVVDSKTWKLDPGDWVVMLSHGGTRANQNAQLRAAEKGEPFQLFHSEVTKHQIAALIAESKTPEEATRKIAAHIKAQWQSGAGEPGDLTVNVMRAPN